MTEEVGAFPESAVDPMKAATDENAKLGKKIADVKTKVQSTFGQVVLAMSAVDRYRHMMLLDLQHMVINPLLKDRIVLALPAAPDHDGKAAGAAATIAIWASVSEEIDTSIREQIKANVFPLRLKSEDWASGEIVWLLDVIAPSEAMATEVLKNFKRIAQKDEINVHPVVARLVDNETLRRMSSQPPPLGAKRTLQN